MKTANTLLARWDMAQIQRDLAASVVKNPTQHPSAFQTPDTPDTLRQLFAVTHTDQEFHALLEAQELSSLLSLWAEEFSTSVYGYDKVEFSMWDFENAFNLVVFTGEGLDPIDFEVTLATFDQSPPVTFCFRARCAAEILKNLCPAAQSLTLHRTDIDGCFCLVADDVFYVVTKQAAQTHNHAEKEAV